MKLLQTRHMDLPSIFAYICHPSNAYYVYRQYKISDHRFCGCAIVSSFSCLCHGVLRWLEDRRRMIFLSSFSLSCNNKMHVGLLCLWLYYFSPWSFEFFFFIDFFNIRFDFIQLHPSIEIDRICYFCLAIVLLICFLCF